METARLMLRDLRDGDADILTWELANFNITRNTGSIPHPYSRADAIAYLARHKSPHPGALMKAITVKPDARELIGAIGLHVDPARENCEIGYWLSETHWGKGYAREAAEAIIEHAFSLLTHVAINACFHDDNPASSQILYRLGFQTIGPCEKFSAAQGKLVPVTTVRLLKENWLAHKKL